MTKIQNQQPVCNKVCWSCHSKINKDKDQYRGTHRDNGRSVLICEICYKGYFQYLDSFDLNMSYELINRDDCKSEFHGLLGQLRGVRVDGLAGDDFLALRKDFQDRHGLSSA